MFQRTHNALLAAIAAIAAIAIVAPGCGGKKDGGGSGVQQADGADGLKTYFTELQAAIKAGDAKKAAAMTRDLIPDQARMKKALKDDAGELLSMWSKQYEKFPKEDALVAKMFQTDPARTEIQVHGATTEDLIAYKPDTPAYNEFPGGAKKLAETALKPGVTFYEVEILEPGKDKGMKYHLFYFDGAKWTMLGPAWRVMK